jgi:hypothetical protein
LKLWWKWVFLECIMSLGSIELVVFILQVNLKDLGFSKSDSRFSFKDLRNNLLQIRINGEILVLLTLNEQGTKSEFWKTSPFFYISNVCQTGLKLSHFEAYFHLEDIVCASCYF